MFSVRKIGSFILAFVLLIIGSILEGLVPKERYFTFPSIA